MSTIPLLPDDEIPEGARDLAARILAREQRVFGATSLSNVWRSQARHPEYMHASWARSRALMQRGDVAPATKEMVASAVSMINACEYWIDSHVAAVMRLGIDELGVTELVGIAEAVSGLNKVAFGLMLDDGDGTAPLLPYPADEDLAEPTRAVLAEIAEVEGRRLGRDGIPGIWRQLARNRQYVAAAWEKYHVLFDGPGIDAEAKLAVGLGVSVTNGCRYFIRYYHDALKHAGWSDDKVLEIFGVVDFYNSFNTLATGMQIESDIRPPASGG